MWHNSQIQICAVQCISEVTSPDQTVSHAGASVVPGPTPTGAKQTCPSRCNKACGQEHRTGQSSHSGPARACAWPWLPSDKYLTRAARSRSTLPARMARRRTLMVLRTAVCHKTKVCRQIKLHSQRQPQSRKLASGLVRRKVRPGLPFIVPLSVACTEPVKSLPACRSLVMMVCRLCGGDALQSHAAPHQRTGAT